MNREKFRKIHDLLMGQLDVSRELSDEEILEVLCESWMYCRSLLRTKV